MSFKLYLKKLQQNNINIQTVLYIRHCYRYYIIFFLQIVIDKEVLFWQVSVNMRPPSCGYNRRYIINRCKTEFYTRFSLYNNQDDDDDDC